MLENNPEPLTESFNILMTLTLKNRIKEYAEKNNVGMASAARHILQHFFETNFEKTETHRCYHREKSA